MESKFGPYEKHSKSFCRCHHLGDGPDSEHAGSIGHGRCGVPGCKCEKFTWSRWTPEVARYLKIQRGLDRRAGK